MNILVSTPSEIEFCNGQYYNNSMSTFIPRYKRLGQHLICLNIIKDSDKPMQNQLDVENVEFVNVFKINSLKSLVFEHKKNAAIVEATMQQVDFCIVHLPSFVAEQVISCAQKYGKPCLRIVVGCSWDAHWNYGIRGKLIAPFRFWTTRRVIYRADYTIYVTQRFLQKRYPTLGKSLGCSDVILSDGSSDILRKRLDKIHKLRSENGLLTLITLAPVDVKYKGQECVIQAIARLKKKGLLFEYHLVGGGNPSYLKMLSKNLGVAELVKFYGSVPHDDITSILDKADIYIQPSKTEGLPRALVEAMSRACPALGSNIAGIPELLDKNCIFRTGNVNDICSLLTSFDFDKMEKCARQNYIEAKNYEFSVLENRRNTFLDEFMNNVKRQ